VSERRHRVVVVGAGFGGLAAARALEEAPVDVEIIDGRNHHTFQPLLYQVATAGLDGDDVCFPIRGVFGHQRNASVRLDHVVAVDLDRRELVLRSDGVVSYDSLVLAPGAVSNTFGIPGVAEHAFGLKSLADAVTLRDHVLLQFERVDAMPSRLGDGTLTFVVAGGGPTGVELAGGLTELIWGVLERDFPHLDLRQARIVLIEATDRLLGTFAPSLGRRARSALEARGVEVLTDTSVASVTATEVVLANGHRIPCHTMIWAAGVKASSLGERLGVELTKGGRVVVRDDLSVPGHPEVFVVGDLAAGPDRHGGELPQVAPVAIQGARHAARQIERRLRGEPTSPFHYLDKGSMATIGRHAAVAQLPGGVRFSGPVGWLAWLALHLVMLIGVRNRVNVLVNWAWNYLTYDRASRIITKVEDEGSEHDVDAGDGG
jgi:NADH dehydrogenase